MDEWMNGWIDLRSNLGTTGLGTTGLGTTGLGTTGLGTTGGRTDRIHLAVSGLALIPQYPWQRLSADPWGDALNSCHRSGATRIGWGGGD